jgi:hypothetical protein
MAIPTLCGKNTAQHSKFIVILTYLGILLQTATIIVFIPLSETTMFCQMTLLQSTITEKSLPCIIMRDGERGEES